MLTVSDLAHGHRHHGRDDLGLAVRDGLDDGSGDELRGHGLAVTELAGVSGRVGPAAGQRSYLHRLTLVGPLAVVQVPELARLALPEGGGRAQGQRVVLAHRVPGRVDGAGLGGPVELELEV